MTESTNVFASLGINPINLFWQMVNFGILLFVLSKVLYKPILKKLDERAQLVKDGIKAAQENIDKLKDADEAREKLLQTARKDIEKMIENAKKDASTTKDEILSQAKEDAQKIMVKQERDIADQLARQEKELQTKVTDLSVSVARKVLEQYFDETKQKELLEKQLIQIAKTKVK